MSDVRVSSGSPTLERMLDGSRPVEPPKPSACRNLFGPVDHDALARELRRHRREVEEAKRSKWNFDFQNHRPLDGRYEWQELSSEGLPEFYSRSPAKPGKGEVRGSRQRKPLPPSGILHGDGSTAGRQRRCSQGSPAEEDAAAGPRRSAEDGATPGDLAAGHSSGPRKRPASDDSSPPYKRANTTTEEAVSEDCPDASSVEQTPKKCSPRRRQT